MNAPERRAVPAPLSAEDRARLVVAVDHDVRQPQHSVDMGLRTLRLQLADLKSLRDDPAAFDLTIESLLGEVGAVHAASRQVADAQRDLVDTILLDSNLRPLQPRVVSAYDLIDRICRAYRPLAGSIDLRAVPSRLTFFSDERHVDRILANLVANAVRHSRATKILVGARRRGTDIVFEVRDNGRGIQSTYVLDVFGDHPVPPTFASATSVMSGLGLYIVRLFADKLGATVKCTSSATQGTRFQLRLPGPLGTVETTPQLTDSAAAEAARHKFVAILADDRDLLRSLQRQFEAIGVELYADTDPLRWLSVVTDLGRVPDLVLLDFQLKAHDCSLQLDIVQRKWGKARTKVIVLTGVNTTPRMTQLAKSVPMMKKPLNEAKLHFLLEILAGHRPLPASGVVSLPG